MVRILCLHGTGSSGAVLKASTAGLRAALPAHWEWEFFDGEVECDPAPGLGDVYPRPFHSYFEIPSVHGIEAAHEAILGFIEDEGPFDAVLGFSEGGAMTTGLLMYHSKLQPFDPPPFRTAILICATLPWARDQEFGVDVTPFIAHRTEQPVDYKELIRQAEPLSKDRTVHPRTRPFTESEIPMAMQKIATRWPEADRFDYEGNETRKLHPEHDPTRINCVTSVHVVGKNDYAREASLTLMKFYQAKGANALPFMEHGGGHEVPRTKAEVDKLAKMIQTAVERSGMMN